MKNIKWFLFTLTISILLSSCGKEYTKIEHGFRTTVDSTTIEVQFYSPEIVRVVKSKTGFDFEKESLAVVKKPESVSININSENNIITASSDKMQVKLDVNTGAISYFTIEAEALITEQAEGAGFIAKQDLGEATFAVKQAFNLDNNEFIYGLGQFQEGRMSQRMQTLRMEQDNMETIVPFMLSNKGYGLYWDNYSITTFTDTLSETSFSSEIGDCIDYYVMAGGNADGVIANMRDLTGQAPMMPYWTYGFWQSKERYKSQDETVGIVKRYREMGVPIDGIVQDWQYWGDNLHWNALEFLTPGFPNPKKFIEEVHALNAHMIITAWPNFGPKTKPYKTFKAKGMLMDFDTHPVYADGSWPPKSKDPSGVLVYDVYHPEARSIYWDYLNKSMFSIGMDGWWLDSTEPDHMNRKDEDYDNKTYLGSFRKVRNAFPLAQVGGVATHQKGLTKDKRVFILTRSAFAGQQRYSANMWSGDIIADWDVLRNQISAGLNFSLTGMPYWNSDIGGFWVWNFPGGYKNKAYNELYVRWMQFGAFCTMMRSHGSTTPRELWYYGKEGDWAYDALKKMIDLRYSMLPYIYSTSWDVTANGSSMMRALVMDYANDKQALDIDNQYMFGKNILVCPVTDPMYVDFKKEDNKYIAGKEDFSKVKTADVYLPTGNQWFDFWTGELLNGGQTINREVPVDILPLYVKAGSIIPFGPDVQYANEKIGPLTVRVYPGADALFTFYDDERDNYNYENGAFATIEMKWNEATQTLTLEEQKGEYKGMPENREISIVKVANGNGIGISYNDEAIKTVSYSGNRVEIQL